MPSHIKDQVLSFVAALIVIALGVILIIDKLTVEFLDPVSVFSLCILAFVFVLLWRKAWN